MGDANPGIAQRYRDRVAVAWQHNRHGHVVAVLLLGNMPRAISGYIWVIFLAWQLRLGCALMRMRTEGPSHLLHLSCQ